MKKVVVANMKMNMSKDKINEYIKSLGDFKSETITLITCPSFIHINLFDTKKYNVGAQNVFFESKGPYTGEISPNQLKELGIGYVIIGHSERRINFNETDEIVNKKLRASLDSNLNVILCIGENITEKNSNRRKSILENQIKLALNNVNKNDLKRVIIAYEPIYCIGGNKALNTNDINDMVKYIKSILLSYESNIPVIYGGSVNENNIKEILNYSDGVMVGGLCTSSKNFISTLNTL